MASDQATSGIGFRDMNRLLTVVVVVVEVVLSGTA
jgi:hypothetical protein